MDKFCGKCGTPIDAATGLCPNCDREKLNKIISQKNFCIHCGCAIDKLTGTCPNCGAGKVQAANTTSPAKVKAKPKKVKSPAATLVTTILLSICLFITSFFALSIYNVRNTLKESSIERMFTHVEDSDVFESTICKNSTFKRFYEYFAGDYDADIASDQLSDFVSESSIKEFIAGKVADFGTEFFTGSDAELTVTREEIVEFVTDNEDEIFDAFDISITNKRAQVVADWVVGEDNDELTLFDSSDIKNEVPILHIALKVCFSYITMFVFILLSAGVIVLMIRNKPSQALSAIGVIFIILGAFTVTVAILSLITPLWSLICADSIVGIMIGNYMTANALISAVLVVAGVVLLVIRRFIKKR